MNKASETLVGASTSYVTMPDGSLVPVIQVQRADGSIGWDLESNRAKEALEHDTFMDRFNDTETIPQSWRPETQGAIKRFRHLVSSAPKRLLATIDMAIGDPQEGVLKGIDPDRLKKLKSNPMARDLIVANCYAMAEADGETAFWQAIVNQLY